MKLGSSIARRRIRRRRRSAPETSGQRSGPHWMHGPLFVGIVAGAALVAWTVAYLVATQIVFPAPPPPGDLFEVPDVRGLLLAEAGQRLDEVGLAIGAVDSLSHPTVDQGSVLGQAPIPGQLASPGAPVRVTISLGPQTRAIPDVRRLDATRARVVLETSGFVVVIDSAHADVPAGRVAELRPPADSVVALPAEVEMVVSMGPPVVTMPDVLGLSREDAIRLLTSRGLVVSEVREVFRFGRDRGIVVNQVPPAETVLERGSAVRLQVGRER